MRKYFIVLNFFLGALFVLFLSVVPGFTAENAPLSALPPLLADNQMTPEKIALGKMLFFDPRLSSSNWISCASCHNPALAFTDRLPQALGDNMTKGPRNTPTILNAAFLEKQFWDGRAATLEEQALGPIQAAIEMNESLENVLKKLAGIPQYVKRFQDVFGKKEPFTARNLAKALAAFERTLVTPNAPFDRYLQGDTQALSAEAQHGMLLFEEKGCVDCHSGQAFSDSDLHEIVIPGSADLGKFLSTKKDVDKYYFRTPSLRNVCLTAPYMSDGSVATLAAAVTLMGKVALHETLTTQEVAALVVFLESLTGELPQISYPELP